MNKSFNQNHPASGSSKREIVPRNPQTHHEFAMDALSRLTVRDWAPIFCDGMLYCVDERTGLWRPLQEGELLRVITEHHDGKRYCSKYGDYQGITQIALNLSARPSFFADSPTGLACPSGFYSVSGDAVSVQTLNPEHRQRVRVEFDPEERPTPLFDNFLHETFHSSDPAEEQQQRSLLQEITGAVMFGLMHRQQKAVLLSDPYGRAGKGTFVTVLRQLVPKSLTTAVSPFDWNREYYAMTLAGSRLNVVGELPDDQAIPAAHFKSVIGSDLITGRNPSGRPVSFVNEAAHIFMSNHLITTRDYSEAFFSRWIILEFPNSRTKLNLPVDPDTAARIIDSELAGVAFWALQGAQRLLRQGRFSESRAHDRLLAKWRRTSSSLEEFVHECCDLGEGYREKRTTFYEAYTSWCRASGRPPFAKTKLKELMLHNIRLGVRAVEVNGYETFRGIRLREGEKPSLDALDF